MLGVFNSPKNDSNVWSQAAIWWCHVKKTNDFEIIKEGGTSRTNIEIQGLWPLHNFKNNSQDASTSNTHDARQPFSITSSIIFTGLSIHLTWNSP